MNQLLGYVGLTALLLLVCWFFLRYGTDRGNR